MNVKVNRLDFRWSLLWFIPFLAGAAALSRFPHFPLNDDWMYLLSLKRTLETGALWLCRAAAPAQIFHVVWGALFAMPKGFSFEAARLATLTLAGFGLFSFERALRELGAESSAAALATLTLLLNPLFFSLSFSFMTDVPGLALMLCSGYAYILAAKRGDVSALLAGALFCSLAYLVRETGLCMAAGAVLWLWVNGERRPSRYLYAAGLPAAVAAIHIFLMRKAGPETNYQTYVISATVKHLSQPGAVGAKALARLAGASIYVGAFAVPWTLQRQQRRGGSWPAIAGLAVVWIVMEALRLAPATGNVVGYNGLGVACLEGSACMLRTAGIFRYPPFWHLVRVVGLASAGLLTFRLWSQAWLLKTPWLAYGSGFALAFLASLAGRDYYDRYYLPLFPLVLSIAVLNVRLRLAPMLLGLLMLGSWAGLGTWDCLAWNEARWKAAGILQQQGISPERISNGMEWNGYHGYEAGMGRIVADLPAMSVGDWDWWSAARCDGFTSFVPIPPEQGLEPVGRVRYWSPLSWNEEFVYMWRRMRARKT